MKTKLCLLFLVISVTSSFSSEVRFYNINDLYGTSIREVYSVCKDDRGFIWGASKTGVLRISENNCRMYQIPYKTTDVFFTRLVYENSLLIAYSNNGQYFLYDELYDRFDLWIDIRELSSYASAKGVVVDANKNLWLGTSMGLFRYEDRVLKPAVEENKEIQHIARYDDRRLFLGLVDGMALFDIHTCTLEYICEYKENDDTGVSGFLGDIDKEILWIGTLANGVLCYDLKEKRFISLMNGNLPMQPVLSIEKSTFSTLLVGIDGQGVWELTEDGQTLLNIYKEDVNDPFSLHGDGVYDIFCDRNERVWVATFTGGLSFFDRNRCPVTQITHQINTPNSLGNNHVNKVLEDKRGNIWFATNNGVSKWNPVLNKWNVYYENTREQAKVFLTICEDEQGNIWAGTYSSGVYVIDGITGREINHYFDQKDKNGFSCKYISDIFKDSQGNIWMGGVGNIICYLEKEKRFRVYDSQPLYSFTELSSEKLLLGCDHGLIVMDKLSGDRHILLGNCLVQDVVVMGDDIWLGTAGDGLVQYNIVEQTFKKYTTDCGVVSNYVNSIMFANGYLWLGTENGLCQFDPESKQVNTYFSSLLLSNASFNMSSRCYLRSGELMWGTNKGAIHFNPDWLFINQPKGAIFIQDINISGLSIRENKAVLRDTPVNDQEKLLLNYNQNNFVMELLPLGLSSGGAKFSWKLEGLDTEWTQPSDLHLLPIPTCRTDDSTLL
ncbi:MAG: AraC family transcriptional regulator [Bacteroides sp.]|nr:AraC family transcriptional regulator [Bacteroides sp.]